MRIVGVDRIPSTPFDRGDAPRKPVLTTAQVRTRKAKRALAARGLTEARDLVVHLQAAGRAVRRRPDGTGARQSDRGRIVRHAAEPHSRPGRRRADATPTAAFPTPRCSRSARFSGATSRRTSSSPRPACAARWRRPSGIGRHWSGKAARRRRLRRQGRRARGAGRRRRARAGVAGRARRAGLVPSRPLRHHPDRPAERARPFRRAASARARGARRRRARWSPSRSFWNAFPKARRRRRAPSRCWSCRSSSR